MMNNVDLTEHGVHPGTSFPRLNRNGTDADLLRFVKGFQLT